MTSKSHNKDNKGMSNKASGRKAKEIQNRDGLILSVAQSLLAEKGLQGMTMQAIADQTDYSKGTIYQHYGCKEEILATFVLRGGQRLIYIMDQVLESDHSLRYKLLLFSASFLMNTRRQPEITGIVAMVKSPEFQNKLSAHYQSAITQIDNDVLMRILRLFTVDNSFDCSNAKQAAFGWWAMQWGVQDILANGWELSKLGFDHPEAFFFDSLHIFLNGLGVEDDAESRDTEALQRQAKQLLEASFEYIKTIRKTS